MRASSWSSPRRAGEWRAVTCGQACSIRCRLATVRPGCARRPRPPGLRRVMKPRSVSEVTLPIARGDEACLAWRAGAGDEHAGPGPWRPMRPPGPTDGPGCWSSSPPPRHPRRRPHRRRADGRHPSTAAQHAAAVTDGRGASWSSSRPTEGGAVGGGELLDNSHEDCRKSRRVELKTSGASLFGQWPTPGMTLKPRRPGRSARSERSSAGRISCRASTSPVR